MDDVKGPDTSKEFERLVKTYQSQLRRLCCMILKDAHLAEDAVQECFLYLANHFHYARGKDEKSVRSALTVLVKSRSLNLIRGRKDTVDLEEAEVSCPGSCRGWRWKRRSQRCRRRSGRCSSCTRRTGTACGKSRGCSR